MKNFLTGNVVLVTAFLLFSCTEIITNPDDDSCENICAPSEMIIGCDDRVVLPEGTNTTETTPWNFIGDIYPGGCTGTLISDRHVLTAAHCLGSLTENSQLGFALAQSAQNEEHRPYGTHGVRRIYIPNDFEQTNSEVDRSFDYAILELFEPITNATPASWGYVDPDILINKEIFSAGYPGQQPDGGVLGRPWITDGQYQNAQPFSSINGGESGLLYSNLDGVGGQSGSPVYTLMLPSEHEGDGIISMVHGVMVGSPVASCEQDQNWVSFLTEEAVERIENIMEPNTIDFSWSWTDLAFSPTTEQGEQWP